MSTAVTPGLRRAILKVHPNAFNRAIALDPKNAEAFVGRSLAKARQGDLDGAIADETHAIELNPKHAMAYVYRGGIKEEKGDHDGALADLNHAVEISPLSALVLLARSRIKSAGGDYSAALDDCNRAVKLTPTWPDALNARANVRAAMGDLDGAMADSGETIRLGPKRALGYNLRGRLKADQGDYKGALENYGNAIQINPKSPIPFKLRGVANVLQKRYADALADFRRSRELNKGRETYCSFFIWMLRSRLGVAGDAAEEVAADADVSPRTVAGVWAREVGEFLRGRVSEADLFMAARSPSSTTESRQRCEADYYAGMKKLLAGDKTGAATLFHDCVDTGQITFNEYMFAKAELRELELTPAE